ncbi:MAG: hypothetical protein Q8N89_02875 [Azonexus sp.]|nr:hypothetical protein [Azonexus sp.]
MSCWPNSACCRATYNERYLCATPQKRVCRNGLWDEGLLPQRAVCICPVCPKSDTVRRRRGTACSTTAPATHGNALRRPVPGSLFHGEREKMAQFENPRITLAHADLSGFSLFEEAQYRGLLAAERLLRRLRSPGNAVAAS